MRAVIVDIGGQVYALPAASVCRVVDLLPISPLPFMPDYVEGLIAVGGQVIGQIDLGRRLGLPAAPAGQGQVVVVATGHGEIGLRIGRVLRMTTVADEDMSAFDHDAAGGDDEAAPDGAAEPAARVICAEFQWEDRTAILIDPEALSLPGAVAALAEGLVGLVGVVADTAAAASAAAVFPALVVAAAGEQYAVPLDRVVEVYGDCRLTVLPQAPAEVAGLSVLRGHARLALSLARLVGLSGGEAASAMVIVSAGDTELVLAVERLVGLRRFELDKSQTVGDEDGLLDRYLIDSDGAVIGGLCLDRVLSSERLARLGALLPAADQRGSGQAAVAAARKLLPFLLGAETCAVEAKWIDRVEGCVPLEPLPQSEGSLIAGVINVGGRVVPVIDAGMLVGGATLASYAAYLVLRGADDRRWAIGVSEVHRLMMVPEAAIQPHSRSRGDCLDGIACLDGKIISIVSVERMTQALAQIDAAAAPAMAEVA